MPTMIISSCSVWMYGSGPVKVLRLINITCFELFADENDEAGKSRQIHYDDAAIDRLLNRDQLGDEDATMDDEENDGFLKAFKVCHSPEYFVIYGYECAFLVACII
ncbi:CHD3-type chromatin-remodeling factor CHR7 [Camellia lanceoleosa]|uniref:CHD3-type chromatin-remodeling factor CHR7 n=1 Tax=Camellia lanceoleosa TaxID=1840588 RepID=A0ACC0H7V2_9ERIC|nr:CHD3-type chromatin-remodeling factor CHR7 [Camellia lanceoleosa]